VAGSVLSVATPATAQVSEPPAAVERFDVRDLEGEWYEVATTRSGPCVRDTRFTIGRPTGRHADVVRICTGRGGIEGRRGRVRGPRDGTGMLSLRFAPSVFGWVPGVWTDYWVLAAGDGETWMLLGDRRRRRLVVWARVVSLDEAALAAAIGEARRQGFDVERLAAVPHTGGATGLSGQ
jgi:lipocalin